MQLPHDKFQRVIDPANQVFMLLAAHWISLEQVMAVICETEHLAAATKTPDKKPGAQATKGNTGWLKFLNGQVDREHAAYNTWPVWVQTQLDRDKGFFGRTL